MIGHPSNFGISYGISISNLDETFPLQNGCNSSVKGYGQLPCSKVIILKNVEIGTLVSKGMDNYRVHRDRNLGQFMELSSLKMLGYLSYWLSNYVF